MMGPKVITPILAASIFLTGCLEYGQQTETKPENLNDSTFEVIGSDPNPPQNPEVEIEEPVATLPTPGSRGLIINQGATITANQDLSVELDPPFMASFVKVVAGDSCDVGDYQNFFTFPRPATVTTPVVNGVAKVSAKYSDIDGRTSDCYTRSIIVDKVGPEIVYSKYPNGVVEEGNSVELVFNVSDPYSGVTTVTCEFAGISKPCSAGSNTVMFPSMAEGLYKFNVIARDQLGNESQKSIEFQVSSLYRRLSQRVNVLENKKVDILFVIDNSGSMEYEQKSMASRVQNFVNVIQGLDWRIGVTTTDMVHSTLGDGRLLAMKGLSGTYVLTSAMDTTVAKNSLSSTLQRSETGSGSEQGIAAAYRALERSRDGSQVNSQLIRDDAQLAVIVISDEDESANNFRNDPSNFVSYINSTWSGQKAMSFHSIITRPGDTQCKNTYGATYGYRYEQISKLTGGVIGDVCALDYAVQVQGIAEGVRRTLKTISLSCEPVVDATKSIVVLKDGQPYSGTYRLEGVNLAFDDMLPVGQYDVQFVCVK